MSRDIKFRAWDKEKKCFITPIIYGDKVFMDARDFEDWIPWVNHDTQQYTGLHDKNGKEIYEGDYLRCKKYIGGNFVDHCYESGYVEFVHGAFGLHRKQGFYRPFKDWLEDYELEVIGNIYEHPELLTRGTPNE
jgi:uncharacterized phage protein (TIGR01671 family)